MCPEQRIQQGADDSPSIMGRSELERHAPLLDTSPDALIVADAEGRIAYANKHALDLFGYRFDALVGQPVEVLVPERLRGGHEGNRVEYMANPSVRPMMKGRDLMARRADGSEFISETSLNPLQAADGTFVVAAVRDITDRKRVEHEALRRSEEMEYFAHAVSHDLKSPLSVVDWLIEEALEQLAGEDKPVSVSQVQATLRKMSRVVGDAMRTVDALLDLAQVEVGEREVATHGDVQEVVGRVVDALATIAKRHGVSLAFEAREPVPLAMSSAHMTALVQNLVQNAIKFVPDETGQVRVSVVRKVDAAGTQFVVLMVEDNGPGVPEEQRDMVFRIFYKGDADAPVVGTGIGLALVRKIARIYGGDARVEDSELGGARFEVWLPVSGVALRSPGSFG